MGPRVIYIPFLLANTILGKPVLSERPLNKFLSVRERNHYPESSEEELIFENDCQWKPGEHFRNSSLGCKKV